MTWVCRLDEEVIGTSLWCSEERGRGSATLLEALLCTAKTDIKAVCFLSVLSTPLKNAFMV